MSYQSMEEAKLRGEKENIPFWKAIQLEDAQERDVKIEDSWEKMKYMWQSMLDALDAYEPDKVSRSGLVGTEGGLMDNYRENEEPLCGDFVSKVMSNALKMGCNNACMKRIVAAPTAGACGVLPAVLVTYYKEYNVSEEKMIEASMWQPWTWSDHCQPGISCGSIGRMSGRDRFRFGNGSRGNLLYQRRRYGSDRTCLCDGIEEPDGTCM